MKMSTQNMNSTNDYIRAVLDTVRYDFGDLMVANLFWVLLCLPIITIPPAFAGLYYSTSKLARGQSSSRQTFFEGFKKYFRTSYYWFFSNVIVVGLLFNIDLSAQNTQLAWLQFFSGVSWMILTVWVLLQIYTFPLLIQQDVPRIVLAMRNSAVLWFKNVRFSLLLSVIIILLVLASIYLYPFWFVITAGLIAYLANLGVVYLLLKG
jgi:hypothetical protein